MRSVSMTRAEGQIFSAGTCRSVDRETRVAQHFLSDSQQLAVGGDLLPFPLGRGHALELLHSAAGAAFTVGESRHVLAGDLAQASDQTCQNAHPIPEQSGVGGPMNIGFHNGAVNAQRVAILQIRLDGGGNDQVIYSFKQSPASACYERG